MSDYTSSLFSRNFYFYAFGGISGRNAQFPASYSVINIYMSPCCHSGRVLGNKPVVILVLSLRADPEMTYLGGVKPYSLVKSGLGIDVLNESKLLRK